MFVLLEIAPIYKALKLFDDLQGPTRYKDPHGHRCLCYFGETPFNARH